MRIVYEPAECVPECDQPDCPYMHTEAWLVGDNVFRTQLEAQNFVDDQATLKTGDALTDHFLGEPDYSFHAHD